MPMPDPVIHPVAQHPLTFIMDCRVKTRVSHPSRL
jgi:hypothetical protein